VAALGGSTGQYGVEVGMIEEEASLTIVIVNEVVKIGFQHADICNVEKSHKKDMWGTPQASSRHLDLTPRES